jgi:hypothetical protein
MNWTKFFYQLRNWKAHWRAFWLGAYVKLEGIAARAVSKAVTGDKEVIAHGRLVIDGRLDAVLIRKMPDGTERRFDLGCLGRRVVTTVGVNYLRDDFAAGAGSADISNFKYHDSGIGTNAEAIGDTALQTPTGDARVAGTQDNSVAKTYKSVATISYAVTKAVTEHGLFSASSAGTLWDRTVFAVINVTGGTDSILFTYTLSISDGG